MYIDGPLAEASLAHEAFYQDAYQTACERLMPNVSQEYRVALRIGSLSRTLDRLNRENSILWIYGTPRYVSNLHYHILCHLLSLMNCDTYRGTYSLIIGRHIPTRVYSNIPFDYQYLENTDTYSYIHSIRVPADMYLSYVYNIIDIFTINGVSTPKIIATNVKDFNTIRYLNSLTIGKPDYIELDTILDQSELVENPTIFSEQIK